MSMLTLHTLIFAHAKQRLEAAGVCPPDVLHDARGEVHSFAHVLDYTRCDPDFAAEVRSDFQRIGRQLYNADTKQYETKGYTPQDLDELCK